MKLEWTTNPPLSVEVKSALLKLGYGRPTEVQAKVVEPALKGKDLVVQSQTGSGKTAAFCIPICEQVDWEENNVQALILTPTRELAEQVKEEVGKIGREKRIHAVAIYGKASFEAQKLALKQKTHVVVGTPGRVLDHLQKGSLVTEQISIVVIDEADHMLGMGFIDQVQAILDFLPEQRTTMLFSATMPEEIVSLSKRALQTPIQIRIKSEVPVEQTLEHAYVLTEENQKLDIVHRILIHENPDRCLIFCNTQEQVINVTRFFRNKGYRFGQLHGGMWQKDRFSVLEDFINGQIRYVVATDVAGRGIHVDDVSHVIHYDLPEKAEGYIHRSGRTARAGNTGKTIALVTKGEQNTLNTFAKEYGLQLKSYRLPHEKHLAKQKQQLLKKMNTRIKSNADSQPIDEGIMKLYFNGGKKKKIRALDYVGTITQIKGVTAEDIGIISIQETCAYVDILNGKGPIVLKEMQERTVKGKKLKVHRSRK